mgnify:FL=1
MVTRKKTRSADGGTKMKSTTTFSGGKNVKGRIKNKTRAGKSVVKTKGGGLVSSKKKR